MGTLATAGGRSVSDIKWFSSPKIHTVCYFALPAPNQSDTATIHRAEFPCQIATSAYLSGMSASEVLSILLASNDWGHSTGSECCRNR